MAFNKNDKWVHSFTVTDPKKHRKGFTVYKVSSIVYPKASPEAASKVIVWKRYNDFKKLNSIIKDVCKKFNIKETVPNFAKVKLFNRFQEDVINSRIQSAIALLEFIGKYSVLYTSDCFTHFFETSYEMEGNDYVVNGNGRHCLTDIHSNCDMLNTTTLESDMLEKESPFLKLGGTWEYRQDPDLISFSSHSSSEQTTYTSDTGESSRRINSPLPCNALSPQRSNQQVCDLWLNNNPLPEVGSDCVNQGLRMSQSCITYTQPDHETSQEVMSKSVSHIADHEGETVTCYTEKPVKSSEMWLSVRTEDFSSMNKNLLAPGLTDSEAWLTPPGTPAGKQDYLVDAAYHVGQAQTFEVAGEYEEAFSCYKAGIASLLSGVQDDKDRVRRKAVRDKTLKYLQRAEQIYSNFLSGKCDIRVSEELQSYKVLNILDKVMLVLHTTDEKCFVIKTLAKSPCPIHTQRKTILPRNVPYMVQLVEHYETNCSIFLVLQYSGGGKLFDHIDRYLQSVPHTPSSPESRDSPSILSSIESVPVPEHSDQKSYVDMIKSYTSYMLGFGKSEEKCEKKEEGDEMVASILRSESETIFDLTSILKQNDEIELIPAPSVDTDTSILVASSQKLLESVNRTLQQSEALMKHVSTDIIHKTETRNIPKDLNCPRKRSSSHMSRAKNRSFADRRFSSEDILDCRMRTASNSLDRGAQWSRLAAMVEPHRKRLPEATIRLWAAEILVALETLHRWGLIIKDFHPANILIGDQGHILLTYQSQCQSVDTVLLEEAKRNLYTAPETNGVFPATPAADWWSYGAILFELITGKTLASCHPYGIQQHTELDLPDFVSTEAASLLTELLRYNPNERLGGGTAGSDDVKAHPFFQPVDWQVVYDNGVVI